MEMFISIKAVVKVSYKMTLGSLKNYKIKMDLSKCIYQSKQGSLSQTSRILKKLYYNNEENKDQ